MPRYLFMTDTANEQLSALMDGELPSSELRFLLRRLDGDAGLVRRWSRFQVISSVFKHEPLASARSADAFAAAIMARLDADTPAIRRPVVNRMLRWAGGGAIAASVAVFALVATRPTGDTAMSPLAGGTVVASTQGQAVAPPVPVGEVHQPLSPQQALPAISFTDFATPASFESIVPNYVPRYTAGQSASGASSNGFVPYVLVVGSRQAPEPQPAAGQDSPAKQ
jgi:sigma-E factor negative regulatory protein RseA